MSTDRITFVERIDRKKRPGKVLLFALSNRGLKEDGDKDTRADPVFAYGRRLDRGAGFLPSPLLNGELRGC